MAASNLEPFRCRACGATYELVAWSALTMIERVDATEVRRVVCGWPDGTSVEVRHCGGCGRSIAARCCKE